MRNIEYLVAWDNRTWTTEVEAIPNDVHPMTWADQVLIGQCRYRKAVMFAVYNDCPDEEGDR